MTAAQLAADPAFSASLVSSIAAGLNATGIAVPAADIQIISIAITTRRLSESQTRRLAAIGLDVVYEFRMTVTDGAVGVLSSANETSAFGAIKFALKKQQHKNNKTKQKLSFRCFIRF